MFINMWRVASMGMWRKINYNAICKSVKGGRLRQERSVEREVALILFKMPDNFSLPGE